MFSSLLFVHILNDRDYFRYQNKVNENISLEFFWVCPFSSPLFRTSGQMTGCSESTIEHNINFPDVRNENRSNVRNEKIQGARNKK
jgi:hypothetical protein